LQESPVAAAPRRQLSLFDSTCIIVGIIIGAGIYKASPLVASCMGSPAATLAIWLVGGFLALTGALCYAELATAYPREGGDYVYLSRAYGRPWGWLFGWTQLVIIRPGDIALMAFVFGTYAETLYAPGEGAGIVYAAAAIGVLTIINVLGVAKGKWTQNILTVVKALGLLAVVVAGLLAPGPTAQAAGAGELSLGGLRLALILVLFTFGGWHEMAYVAAEVKRPERNIVRALVLGTVAVTVLYLLVNAAFLRSLGYAGMTGSKAVAVDAVAATFPKIAARAIAVVICISALGAANGLVFTGARISYALGAEHAAFRGLGTWHPKLGTPVGALVVQGVLSMGIVLVAGSFVNTILYAAPIVWVFFLATGLSVVVLRMREPDTERPYKALAYPVTPLLFVACCVFMLYSSVTYAWEKHRAGLWLLIGVFAAGVVVWWATEGRSGARRE
jgi:amino acid transporter